MKDIISIIKENEKRYLNPLGLDKGTIVRWAKGMDLVRSETVFYTGGLYQMVPYIEKFASIMEKMYGISSTTIGIARLLSRAKSLASLVPVGNTERYNKIIRNIFTVLRTRINELGYLWEDDIYSGALYYDLGLNRTFESHIKVVSDIMRRNNVKKVITIDPHTNFVLRELMPKYTDFDVEVLHYTEVLSDLSIKADGYVLHEPCYMARWYNLSDKLCSILNGVKKPKTSGTYTNCCGGPIESLFPKIAKRIANNRLRELRKISENVLVSCPICLANLSRAGGANIVDVGEVIL
ncbi:(Fe-S)-binding protein [Candidatus Methanodesulfokora washburnensis]|uniref:(Fe-S)-binding protein n=1 Tax=Candidatus Methanodesulfokora washburnensis TaxID=2478471 RepID=A0A3R9PSG2_9CREN|nr:(Fe-S)-binding protein [Candidatus Methanodesulfokores washburnensis]RSN71441.1 (Fe-S)-binding protein [Candidatus Methanodesulfokores washburnensis]